MLLAGWLFGSAAEALKKCGYRHGIVKYCDEDQADKEKEDEDDGKPNCHLGCMFCRLLRCPLVLW